MPLTDSQIKRLKPSDTCTPSRPDKYSDGNNLRLWVRSTGSKVWVSDYKYAAKRQSLTIGKYPAMSLADARQRNQQIKDLIKQGINPKHDKKRLQADTDGSRAFDIIAQRWHDDRKAHIAPTTYSRDYSQYQRDIKPVIGHMNIEDITAPDVLAIGKAVEARGATDMARRAIRQTGQIFKQAIREGLITHNPASNDLTAALKPHKVTHHHRITSQQLPKLLQDIDAYGGHLLVKLGFWVLAYTFVRTKELRMMEWCEIDHKAKIWRIPAEKMKMGRPHIVPLAPQVMAILEQIRALGLSDKYVFYNTERHQPYSENAFSNALKRMGYKDKMTGHGFRGLASTTLHEREFMHEAIELQLAHEKENKISKAYNGAQHLPYRTDMMKKWANFITDIYEGKDAKTVYTSFTPKLKQEDFL